MNIKLVGINEKLIEAWNKVFQDVEQVSIVHNSIFNCPCDAIVSPANSFGYMNGGLDFTISKNLGWHIEKRLQQKIRTQFYGELLIGQSTIVTTDHNDFPNLIASPTMRTPMTILRTPNIYLAMKAILVLLKHGKFDDGTPINTKVKSVAIPGLGTGVGQVPPLICARQMRLAWEDVMNEKYKTTEGWEALQSNYAYFYTLEERDIKYDIS